MKMKKNNLLILAVAALGFAACANDETTAVNEKLAESNEISFRSLVNGNMRAVEKQKTAWATGDQLDVFAEYKVGGAAAKKYFKDTFTKIEGGNFQSVAKYYWPAMPGNEMTFTSFYGVAQSETTAGSLAETFTPASAAASQTDIMYARKTLNGVESPVGLNFRHMLSQIDVKVRNSNASLEFDITGVRIGYVSISGTFACTASTVTANENLERVTWTPTVMTGDAETKANTYKYDVESLTQNISGKVDDATGIGDFSTWMLIPQHVTGATAYAVPGSAATTNPQLNGAYIAIKMNIKNTLTDDVIVGEQWCYWKIASIDWNPGYKYTYIVDLAGGGYQPADQNGDGELDPVLGTPIEMDASCTIDAWDTPSDINVGM